MCQHMLIRYREIETYRERKRSIEREIDRLIDIDKYREIVRDVYIEIDKNTNRDIETDS